MIRTYIRLFKIVRTRHIYVIDHEISSDIDGSCDVYSTLKFVKSLDENGLLMCFLQCSMKANTLPMVLVVHLYWWFTDTLSRRDRMYVT